MEGVTKSINDSLDRVLRFYESVGTPLSYEPKIKYINDISSEMPGAKANIREEYEVLDNFIDFFSKNMMKKLWKDFYCIQISESAIEEATNIQKQPIGNTGPPKYFEKDTDIIVFRPYFENCKTKEQKDEVIAHKIWHLIEKERDVFKKHPFIVEGTANYAMKKFSGAEFQELSDNVEDLLTIMFEGAANIVRYHAKESTNPYKKILENNVRKNIQEDLMAEVNPVIGKIAKRNLENENTQKIYFYILKQIPEFRALQGNLTAQNLSEAYKNLGANQLAEELQNKDLDKLLDSYKRLGF